MRSTARQEPPWLQPDPRERPRIHLLFTRALCRPSSDPFDQLRRALEGGVDVVQVREKDIGAAETLDLLFRVRAILEGSAVGLILNDRVDLALSAGIDGVHLGQDDLPPRHARRLALACGRADLIIGCSTHDLHQARTAAADDCVDYLGIGPLFATATRGYQRGIGPALATEMQAAGAKPCFWIGGIAPTNREALGRPFGIAACAAILGARDPASSVCALRAAGPTP